MARNSVIDSAPSRAEDTSIARKFYNAVCGRGIYLRVDGCSLIGRAAIADYGQVDCDDASRSINCIAEGGRDARPADYLRARPLPADAARSGRRASALPLIARCGRSIGVVSSRARAGLRQRGAAEDRKQEGETSKEG